MKVYKIPTFILNILYQFILVDFLVHSVIHHSSRPTLENIISILLINQGKVFFIFWNKINNNIHTIVNKKIYGTGLRLLNF